MFHGFGQAKFASGGLILGSSQFTLLPQLPLKTMLSLSSVYYHYINNIHKSISQTLLRYYVEKILARFKLASILKTQKNTFWVQQDQNASICTDGRPQTFPGEGKNRLFAKK